MWWKVPRIWAGGDVWIIGGGPSLVEQFEIPVEIVEQVRRGDLPLSAYSSYMEAIHKKHTIGVNVSFKLGSWIDMAFFGDNGFLLKYQYELSNFAGLRVSCNPLTKKYKWIKTLLKDKGSRNGENRTWGMCPRADTVCWNNNSGSAAINVAANMGAKRIFLLGFDMAMNESGQQHWHSEYGTRAERRLKKEPPFKMHKKGFPLIAKAAEERGIRIINVSPNSTIEEFEKMTLKEALQL